MVRNEVVLEAVAEVGIVVNKYQTYADPNLWSGYNFGLSQESSSKAVRT